jgi:hypothetical protein
MSMKVDGCPRLTSTAVSVDSGFESSDDPLRGATTLDAYIRNLVDGS